MDPRHDRRGVRARSRGQALVLRRARHAGASTACPQQRNVPGSPELDGARTTLARPRLALKIAAVNATLVKLLALTSLHPPSADPDAANFVPQFLNGIRRTQEFFA